MLWDYCPISVGTRRCRSIHPRMSGGQRCSQSFSLYLAWSRMQVIPSHWWHLIDMTSIDVLSWTKIEISSLSSQNMTCLRPLPWDISRSDQLCSYFGSNLASVLCSANHYGANLLFFIASSLSTLMWISEATARTRKVALQLTDIWEAFFKACAVFQEWKSPVENMPTKRRTAGVRLTCLRTILHCHRSLS